VYRAVPVSLAGPSRLVGKARARPGPASPRSGARSGVSRSGEATDGRVRDGRVVTVIDVDGNRRIEVNRVFAFANLPSGSLLLAGSPLASLRGGEG